MTALVSYHNPHSLYTDGISELSLDDLALVDGGADNWGVFKREFAKAAGRTAGRMVAGAVVGGGIGAAIGIGFGIYELVMVLTD